MNPTTTARRPCSEAAEQAWIQLLRAHRAALGSVERELRAGALPPLEWYDVLLELERAGPLRPRDLQDRLLVAQYNLSRLLDRMEKRGLLARKPCPDDARSQLLHISDEGRAMRQRMWPIYGRAIENAVGAKLTAKDAERLAELLGHLRGSN